MNFSELTKLIKLNLSGRFFWNNYVKYSPHDHKFGPNLIDYLAQIPVVGLAFVCVMYIFLTLVFAAIRPFQIYHESKDKKHKKVLK